jgi:hypothetical protein
MGMHRRKSCTDSIWEGKPGGSAVDGYRFAGVGARMMAQKWISGVTLSGQAEAAAGLSACISATRGEHHNLAVVTRPQRESCSRCVDKFIPFNSPGCHFDS